MAKSGRLKALLKSFRVVSSGISIALILLVAVLTQLDVISGVVGSTILAGFLLLSIVRYFALKR